MNIRERYYHARRNRIHDISKRIDWLREHSEIGVKEVDENIDLEIEKLVEVREAILNRNPVGHTCMKIGPVVLRPETGEDLPVSN